MDNDTTLQSYNDHIEDYVASTPSPTVNPHFKHWIDQALKLVPTGGEVLELGSGPGHEASYVEGLGYKVTRSDAAQGFVDRLIKQGHDAKLLNALTDDYGSDYDMVLAHAVLLHFSPKQSADVLKRALACLKPGGIFAFSLKEGHGGKWSNEKIDAPRYFQYWQKQALEKLVNDSRFKLVEIIPGTSRSATWLQVIAQKPAG